MRAENVLQLVGDTPMIQLENINPNPEVPIYHPPEDREKYVQQMRGVMSQKSV
ncbi:MAG: hypothetical protein KGY66_02215 [Candidatus Thermoplasmatota archaeon]|nr:hypothetical protein [Candidatus Thermoplasmatota archaeon]MBS3789711.1 hypothetical protein [Candidatus Thermoplasmatota archaeon]